MTSSELCLVNWNFEVNYSQVNKSFRTLSRNNIKTEIRGVFIDVTVGKEGNTAVVIPQTENGIHLITCDS